MIVLDRIVLREIRMPLVEAFGTSTGTTSERRILLVETIDKDGAIGWGECVAQESPGYLPEIIDTAWPTIRDWVSPLVLGQSFDRPHDVASVLDASIRGNRMAKAAIEMSLWALEAQRRGVSLSKLLGGTRDRVAAGISIGLQSGPQALADRAVAAQGEGYRRIKMKIAPGRDVAFVHAVRDALGPNACLSVDANSAYTLDDTETLRDLDTFGASMIEQPLGWDDFVDHARLQREVQTPICLDESIAHAGHARAMIELGSGGVINIKPGRVGGFSEAVAIHDVCASSGIPVWCGGMLESGIGRAHNVALASLPNFTMPGDLSPSARYWERDIVTPAWTMDDDGYVTVPHNRPGLGVEIDRGRIEDLCVRTEAITAG